MLTIGGYEYRVLCVKNNMITSVEVKKLKPDASKNDEDAPED